MISPAISPGLLREMVAILCGRKKAAKIVLFGSRARGDAGKTSDVDLAVMDDSWTDRDINLAKDALEEGLKTPLKIDLVNFRDLKNKRLRDHILKEGKVIHESR